MIRFRSLINYLSWFILVIPISILAHEGQEERIQFWKDYYHPKLEVVREDIPNIKINLKKIGPFFQLHTQVENFKITPDQDLKNNNTWTGYGKLFINGVYTSRIYGEYFFIREMPVGNNEIKVILSSNMDVDIAYQDKLISDSILFQFPEYTFSEARSKAYNLSIQCEFSDEGLLDRDKLQKVGMQIFESSKYLQCRHDSQKYTLDDFMSEMSKFQLASHIIHLDILMERIKVWQDFENSRISLSEARSKNRALEEGLEVRVEKKFNELKVSN
ncbi:MAG: hypothetical protein VX890_00840 [Pseudomonadota bacterium]|nr:hypothetical protein [Pseudomonadota bacterium]|tara:strand:- start:1433 stop:2251 length:819 start_codon:yes stop_codon:yes gene_type:complete